MRLLVIFIVTIYSLFAQNSYQLPLQRGVWHLIGINGLHHEMPLEYSFESGGRWMQIKEDNGAGFTGDYLDAITKNSSNNPNQGDIVYSTITLEILDRDTAITDAIINYELIDKDSTIPMRTMYISSGKEGRVADMRLRYQGTYEGEIFYLKVDSSIIFEGKFNLENTQENPLYLKPRKRDGVGKIVDLFDSNLTDNRVDKLDLIDLKCQSINCVSEGEVVGGVQKMADANITAYEWNDNIWKTFAAAGLNNSFDEFRVGKAYWVKIDAKDTGDEVGFILGKGDLDNSIYKQDGFVKQRWNLLSFNDSFIRTAPTAVFVPKASYDALDLIIRDNFSRQLANISTNGSNMTPKDLSFAINLAQKSKNDLGQNSFKLRAYPAKNGAVEGVVIISDEDFDLSIANLKTVANQDLLPSYDENNINYFSSRSDEYIVAVDLNDYIFGVIPALGLSIGGVQVDLSAANTLDDVRAALTAYGAIFIDSGFDDSYKTMLLAKLDRFYLRDNTHQKLYAYDGSVTGESFDVAGVNEVIVNYGVDIDGTIANINAVFDDTKVYATKIGTDKILLTTKDRREFFVREKGKRSQFVELDLIAGGNLAKGAISKSYLTTALATVDIKPDGSLYEHNVFQEDLKHNALWAPDFPTNGPIYALQKTIGSNSSAEMIVSGVTKEDKTIIWRQADLTVPANLWRNSSARFNLLKLNKERGYWVYMRTGSEINEPTIDRITIDPAITTSYSNIFNADGSNAVAPTQNRIDLRIAIDASGLGFLGYGATQMAESVTTIVNGTRYDLGKIGGSNQYETLLSNLPEQSSVFPQTALHFSVANGLGGRKQKVELFDNIRPDAPIYYLDVNKDSGTRGAVVVDPIQASKIAIYDNNISNGGSNTLIYAQPADSNITVDLLSHMVYGTPTHPFYDLRIVGTKPNKLQSDTRRLFYAPVYKATELLSTTTTANATPIKFSHTGQEFQPVVDNNNLPTDSGVLLGGVGNLVVQTYSPIGGASLAGCTVATTELFIAGMKVAETTYCPPYAGKVFYLYTNDTLAYGIFGETDLTVIDTNQSIIDPRLP